jgi:hypothetical protein
MRLALADHFGSKTVGLGGVFVIEKGKAKFHIMVNQISLPIYKTSFTTKLVLHFYLV